MTQKLFTLNDARKFISEIKLNMKKEKFTENHILEGMNVELEHGTQNSQTNVTDDDLVKTGKIALAHLRESPDYYDKLKKMEKMKGGKIKIYKLNFL